MLHGLTSDSMSTRELVAYANVIADHTLERFGFAASPDALATAGTFSLVIGLTFQ